MADNPFNPYEVGRTYNIGGRDVKITGGPYGIPPSPGVNPSGGSVLPPGMGGSTAPGGGFGMPAGGVNLGGNPYGAEPYGQGPSDYWDTGGSGGIFGQIWNGIKSGASSILDWIANHPVEAAVIGYSLIDAARKQGKGNAILAQVLEEEQAKNKVRAPLREKLLAQIEAPMPERPDLSGIFSETSNPFYTPLAGFQAYETKPPVSGGGGGGAVPPPRRNPFPTTRTNVGPTPPPFGGGGINPANPTGQDPVKLRERLLSSVSNGPFDPQEYMRNFLQMY